MLQVLSPEMSVIQMSMYRRLRVRDLSQRSRCADDRHDDKLPILDAVRSVDDSLKLVFVWVRMRDGNFVRRLPSPIDEDVEVVEMKIPISIPSGPISWKRPIRDRLQPDRFNAL